MVDIINGIRIAEDAILSLVTFLVIAFMFYAYYKLKDVPVGKIPALVSGGFIPFFMWKFMGVYRRIFIDKAAAPELYTFLHDTGEVFEALTGLGLAVVLIAILYINKHDFGE